MQIAQLRQSSHPGWHGRGQAGALRVLGRRRCHPPGGREGPLASARSFQGSTVPASLLISGLHVPRRRPGRQFIVKVTKFTLGILKKKAIFQCLKLIKKAILQSITMQFSH